MRIGLTRAVRCAVALAVAGCGTLQQEIEALRGTELRRCVVVAPDARVAAPEWAALVDRIGRRGLDVTTVTFPLDVSPVERRVRVASRLAALRPDDGSIAALLIIASDDELPITDWRLAGTDRTVLSDLPLLLGPDVARGDALAPELWFAPLDAPWVVGRIPFESPARIAHMLAAPAPSNHPPRALLGAERHLVWFDTSLVLEDAQDALDERGFETVLYAEDPPRDVALDPEADDAAFLDRWADDAPALVYVNSHGSAMFDLSIGDGLIGPRLLDRHREERAAAGGAVGPRSPAVLVVAACRAGAPWTETFGRLFDEGWTRAIVAPTESTEPTPLGAAIDVQVDFAALLGEGLPVGLALRGAMRRYRADAQDAWSYALFDSTREAVAVNLLSTHLFGDPTVAVVTPAAPGPE